MAFVLFGICLLVQAFDLASCDVQIGNTTSDMRMDGDTIIVVSTDLETCGRACLYQKKCTAINHNSNTSICELLRTEGPLEESLGFNYSDIRTWTMTNDVCHPNPCSDMQACRKNCKGSGLDFDCITFETPCDNSECQNGATCINRYNSYECRCPEGYGGDRCQLALCLETPSVYGTTVSECQNGATCINRNNVYECQCPKGYGGDRCQNVVCFEPPSVYGTTVSDSSLKEIATPGTTINYTCAVGFKDTLGNGGIGYISCMENGTWSTPSNPCSDCSNYSSQFVKIPGKYFSYYGFDPETSENGTAEFCQSKCLELVDCVLTYFSSMGNLCLSHRVRIEDNFTLYGKYYIDDPNSVENIRLCEGEDL